MATTTSNPTQTVQYNYGFAPEVAPYAQDLLGMGAAATYTYKTDANGNPITTPQLDSNGNPILDSNGKPLPGMPEISGFQPYQQYQGQQVAQFSPLQQQSFQGAQNMTTAPQLNAASQLSGAAGLGALNTNYNYQPGSFTNAGTAQQYMNPYLMASLAPQLAIQQQLQGAAQQTQNAQAAQAGAFGGSRAGVQAAATNLNNQLSNQNLIGQGYNTAYNNAMQQFNTENQLGAQNAQFGAGLNLQGLQTANTAAQNLANIGNQQYTQNMGINALQNQYGTQQQQQMQNVLNTQYQNFVNQMNYPYQQLAFMSNLVNKVPMSQTSASTYQSPASQLGQIAGLGIGAASVLSKANGGSISSYKDGGHVQGYADEGFVTDPTEDRLQGMMHSLSVQQLERILQAPTMPGEADAAQKELQYRQSVESQAPILAAQAPRGVMYRDGGPVAFADEGAVKDTDTSHSALWNQIFTPEYRRNMQQLESTPDPIVHPIATGLREAYDYAFKPIEKPATQQSYPGQGRPATGPVTYHQGSEQTTLPAQREKPAVSDHPTVQGAHDAALAHGYSTDDFTNSYNNILKSLREGDAEANKGLTDLIASYGKQAEEAKADSVRKAMQDFGFKMAQEASRTGVARAPGLGGVLQSAAAAAPAITESMNASEKAAQDMDKNRLEMQIAQTRYATSLKKGDQQAALGFATQMRQLQMQQAQLAETKRYHDQYIDLSKQRVAASTNNLQNTMMRTKAGLATNALREADKAWSDPLQRTQLEKQGYTHQSYGKELFNNMWGQTMPQLEYMGAMGQQSQTPEE